MITDYHAKLFAHELTRRFASNNLERFTTTLMGSKVDLNPHQVDSALFAFRSPLSNGALLADEVGLGKTIEAGIVLSQKWAERKRKILIILPTSLRKQWHQELQDKFYLPSVIIESPNFNRAIKQGVANPFDLDEIVICSYHFARNKSQFVKTIRWDLVVIDEAHRLRNVYKTSNKIARELKEALENRPKLLLTATPLQNSLLELYGLTSFIDDLMFGDIKSFRTQYARLTGEDNFNELKQRLGVICKRTLRRQVLEYIRYTERKAHTQEFIPSEDEEVLYDMVSEYLARPNLQALPRSQRSLMTLVLRKLLASSTFAIAGAVNSLANKLEKRLKDNDLLFPTEDLESDFETLNEHSDEYEVFDDEQPSPLSQEERNLIQNEIADLRSFYQLAMNITHNAKGEALTKALDVGFRMAVELGGSEKAIIFTESRRTQDYLLELLSRNGFEDDIVLFNGTNNDPKSKEIYSVWKERYQNTDKVTGSRSADTRAALVEYFREEAKIMIATEAAAEGINLQFCSMVVNYDLPWNPQRIEQRIGRCHRYGQQHDVVVVNFLNKNNAADQRVYQLLSEKFQLFNGIFGASDEVLGAIESGVEFEKRIVEIYQTCRDPESIKAAFDALQEELSSEIDSTMKSTRQKLLENFDTEVAEKLNVYKVETKASINRFESMLWDVTTHVLGDKANFNVEKLEFDLNETPSDNFKPGKYGFYANEGKIRHYRLQHPLAQWVVNTAKERELETAQLVFEYSNSPINISILESLIGKQGILKVSRFTIHALESEDYIICSANSDDGQCLDDDQARRLFNLPATLSTDTTAIEVFNLDQHYQQQKKSRLEDISQRNAEFFDEEMDKLNCWAEDKKKSLEIQIKDTDAEITQLKNESRKIASLDEKVKLQREAKELDKKRTEMRRKLFVSQDEVDQQKENLLDEIESRMRQTIEEQELFCIRWSLQ